MARPSAQGQAMISTATAALKAAAASPVLPSQKPSVATAMAMTTGTNTAEMRSASRCTGALPDCACCTSAAIWASAVSAPTRVARTTQPPAGVDGRADHGVTRAHLDGHALAGEHRGVDGRAALDHHAVGGHLLARAHDEQVARRPAGRSARRRSTPPCTTATSLAPSSSRARSAAPARRLARASKYRPARRNTVTAEATSR